MEVDALELFVSGGLGRFTGRLLPTRVRALCQCNTPNGVLAATGLALALAARPAAAQEDHAADHSSHDFHRHHLAVLVGGMTPLAETSQTSFALGADYEYRFNERWGAGLGADFTFGNHKRTAIFAAGATFRATHALKFATGPGFEVVDTPTSGGGTTSKTYFVWFVSASYEFPIGSVSVAPIVIVDFVGETKTNLTYGFNIGSGF